MPASLRRLGFWDLCGSVFLDFLCNLKLLGKAAEGLDWIGFGASCRIALCEVVRCLLLSMLESSLIVLLMCSRSLRRPRLPTSVRQPFFFPRGFLSLEGKPNYLVTWARYQRAVEASFDSVGQVRCVFFLLPLPNS